MSNWWEKLGVTPDEETKEPEAGQTAMEAMEAQEATETDEITEEEGQPAAEAEEDAQGAERDSGTKGQTREENAKFAAARRKAEKERDDAIAAEREKSAREKDELIARMGKLGMKNPYTGEPMRTVADLEAYEAQRQEKAKEKYMKDNGLSPEQYQAQVEALPEVQQARKTQQEAQAALDAQKQAAMEAQIAREIAEVGQMNPAIRSAEDLAKDPQYETLLQYLEKGLSIPEAYRLTHFDELRAGAGRQKAINQAGKAHLTSTRGRGTGNETVPKGTMRYYRMLTGLSDEQIADDYNSRRQNRKDEED